MTAGPGSAYDETRMAARIAMLDAAVVDETVKGLPPDFSGTFGDVGSARLSLLDGGLPLPVAVLRDSALAANRAWMSRFLALSGVRIAPHGKTPMAPALAQMQMQDGAWGITAATAQQAAVFARLGIRRIIIANQLLGAQNIAIVLGLIAAEPGLDLYCLVDSSAGIEMLARAVREQGGHRPLQVLIDVGAQGGRTGVRGLPQALALAAEVAREAPALALRGVEAYEGIFGHHDFPERETMARKMTGAVVDLARACAARGLFAEGPIVLTAGGTEFFDVAATDLAAGIPGVEVVPVIHSGCYLTHDHLSFERMFRRLLARNPALQDLAPHLTPALEVWAAVQSIPEPGLAFATMGKRDVSYDVEMPVPVHWFRPGRDARPQPMPEGHRVLRLNDQHAFIATPEAGPLRVGDLIGFGVSHVCTTFDKWRSVLRVDDDYRVTGAVRTFF